MFEITVTQRFNASHAIRTADGEFEPIHSHNWRVDVVCESADLDAAGCVVDFAVLQKHLRSSIASWENKNLNDISIFLDIPPSTEYLARCLYDQLEAVLKDEGANLKKVSVWETDNCCASYIP